VRNVDFGVEVGFLPLVALAGRSVRDLGRNFPRGVRTEGLDKAPKTLVFIRLEDSAIFATCQGHAGANAPAHGLTVRLSIHVRE
jgi:hypothetical protein